MNAINTLIIINSLNMMKREMGMKYHKISRNINEFVFSILYPYDILIIKLFFQN